MTGRPVEEIAVAVSPDFLAAVPGLYVEAAIVRGVRGLPLPAGLEARMEALVARWSAPGAAEALGEEPRIREHARLHRELTGGKTVPSVENLVGRYLARGRFPRINPLVDTANVISAEDLLPVGVFDAGRVAGPITLERAQGGDAFVPLGKEKLEKIPPGSAILRDGEKIFSMIGVRDSAPTAVGPETEDLLALSWGFAALPAAQVRPTLRRLAELLAGA